MTEPKVIFFDMGNTLLHFHHGKSDDEKDAEGLIHLTSYLQKFNKNIMIKNVRDDFFNPWMDGIDDRSKTFKEYPIEDFLNPFLKKYNVELTLNECIEGIKLFYTEYIEQVVFEKDILHTLSTLKNKGYKIGVISNTCYYDDVMKECFKKVGIYDCIDSFTFSYSLRIGKPSLEIFKSAMKKMGVSPNEAIMVGDNLRSDVKPALDLGMKAIWFNRNNEVLKGDILPSKEIFSLSELVNYL